VYLGGFLWIGLVWLGEEGLCGEFFNMDSIFGYWDLQICKNSWCRVS